MRNWNIKILKIKGPIIQRFYSTYEELKLTNQTEYTSLKECFYSTYEELKLLSVNVFSNSVFGFYSTYEELKLL